MTLRNYQEDFGPFDGKIWLNSASEGAMPKVSVAAIVESTIWKIKPFQLTNKRFAEVPKKLKENIARLINVYPQDIILGNSASYGIHLLANGLSFKAGDEILCMEDDFPVDILPWLALEEQGVVVKQIKPESFVLQPKEIEAHITPKTRLICLPHVHTFTGYTLDLKTIGQICRKNNILFVGNFTQSIGNQPIDLTEWPMDAITCSGFKWLLSPYSTGFCWMTPELRSQLKYNHAFWPKVLSDEELAKSGPIQIKASTAAQRFDVFGTANFLNFCPWNASIEYLSSLGIDQIQQHIQTLNSKIIDNLDQNKFHLISPQAPFQRSALVVFSHKDVDQNPSIFRELIAKGIYLALWKGNLRIAPHIFNTEEEIEQLLSALNKLP